MIRPLHSYTRLWPMALVSSHTAHGSWLKFDSWFMFCWCGFLMNLLWLFSRNWLFLSLLGFSLMLSSVGGWTVFFFFFCFSVDSVYDGELHWWFLSLWFSRSVTNIFSWFKLPKASRRAKFIHGLHLSFAFMCMAIIFLAKLCSMQ